MEYISLIKTVEPESFAPPQQQIDNSIKKIDDERAIEAAALEAKRKSDCEAAGGVYVSPDCTFPPPQINTPEGVLSGSYGYSNPWGNCVNEPGINNPGWGNPIQWPVLFSKPHIGATVLFTWNHTAIVTGIWGNGDIEVRQQNDGGPHRFPPSMIRGYR